MQLFHKQLLENRRNFVLLLITCSAIIIIIFLLPRCLLALVGLIQDSHMLYSFILLCVYYFIMSFSINIIIIIIIIIIIGNFLFDMFNKGYASSSLNLMHSALNSKNFILLLMFLFLDYSVSFIKRGNELPSTQFIGQSKKFCAF